ncbi:hypothetical protein SPRG_09278 [Saprolegnia parasitica CBS 223.65]|uniref:MalT-like TPR region domain-containing protein n=1 Tax=Saprolegnia parasitica (strain CBS 223.65) TaxID=695850 RepID=A0A067C7I9_SAPPC|nr:hypothetical protein SPRG_09278 [Saprolegnia parasitica CBS 223.65]KDO25130.1 hypothetical protein SPRG_09278 [Saprolegnia parasitica CBS 223.65]|eukprot:XP_012204199.1 hypothetical protein SPRG_09278 [Saprolegnia parasitica CBS 223.65]
MTTLTPPCGLKLSFFRHFIEAHGGPSAFQGLSTADVCVQYVMPYTASMQSSVVDHVALTSPSFASDATWYVSHAWQYLFLDTLASLEAFFAAKNIADPSLWFCLFNNNQHRTHDKLFDWWATTFHESLAAIGNVVMVLHPWKNPTALTRAWCVYEVYVAICVGANFELAHMDRAAFLRDMQTSPGTFLEMLSTIRSEKAQATVASDKASIDRAIVDQVGYTKLDRMVFTLLESYVKDTLRMQMETATNDADKALWASALAETHHVLGEMPLARDWYIASTAYGTAGLGLHHERTLTSRGAAALMRGLLMEPRAVWEPELVATIDAAKTHQRDESDALSIALHSLSVLYTHHALHEEAVPMAQACYDRLVRTKGLDDLDTITTMGHLGIAYHRVGNVAKAESYLLLAYERKVAVLGDDHARTLASLQHLMTLYNEQGNVERAMPLALTATERLSRVLGASHENTVIAKFTLAELHRKQGQFAEAEAQLLSLLEVAKSTFGDDTINVVYIEMFLGMVHVSTKQFATAAKYLDHAVEKRLAWYGPTSPMYEVVLLRQYWLRQLAHQFDSVDAIDVFLAALNAANITHDSWGSTRCVVCTTKIQGALHYCGTCPPFLRYFCANCVDASASTYCSHGRDACTSLAPPSQALAAQRLSLLAPLVDPPHVSEAIVSSRRR